MRLRLSGLLFAAFVSSAAAHPHVFVDGRIDFVFAKDTQLAGIEVTWLYDPLETLYVLAALEIDPGSDWTLSSEERATVLAHESNWADTFDGATRLAQDEDPIPLEPPTDFAVRLVGNQLEVRFERALSQPLEVAAHDVEVTFYEDTYFFAFTIAQAPRFLGAPNRCDAFVDPFDPQAESAALQETLSQLGREETPEDTTIGRLFTDRIHLSCE